MSVSTVYLSPEEIFRSQHPCYESLSRLELVDVHSVKWPSMEEDDAEKGRQRGP